jgi:hypothetical protein
LSLSMVQIHTREWWYSSTHSQHKMDMCGELHAPTAIFLVPNVIKAGWAPEPVWKLQSGYKCLAKAWNQSFGKIPLLSSPQPSHYINCTKLAPKLTLLWRLNHEWWDKIWSLTRKVTLPWITQKTRSVGVMCTELVQHTIQQQVSMITES